MPNDLQPIPPGDEQPLSRLPAQTPLSRHSAAAADDLWNPGPDPVVQLRRYLAFLAQKWWIVLLSVLFFGALAAAYFLWWPAKYGTTAHMWAAGQVGFQLHEGQTVSEDNTTYAGTQVELLQSDFILGRAYVQVTNTLHVTFPTNWEGKPKLPSVKVSQLPKSAVLELKAKGFSPEVTMVFLNAVMDEFLVYKKDIRAASSGDTYTSVSEQIKKQEADLTAAQNKLTAYMKDNNVGVLQERAQAAASYLTQLLQEHSELKSQLQMIDSLMAQGPNAYAAATNLLAGIADPRQLGASFAPSGSAPPDFLTAQQELQKLKILRTRLSQYFRPDHPKMLKLDEQIAEGEQLVDFFSHQTRDQLSNAKEALKIKVEGLQTNITEWEAKVNDASERLAQCDLLKFNVAQLQELHDHLIGLLQTVDVSKSVDQENVTILDRPSEAKDARHTLILAVFLIFVGFGSGFGIVFLLQKSDDHIRSLEELTERLDAQVIGMIPELRTTRAKLSGVKGQRSEVSVNPEVRGQKSKVNGAEFPGSELIIAEKDDRHAYVESFRNLRSALIFRPGKDRNANMLLITSAIPNEGKSTVAANLAKTMALGGAKVLLVDADLRRGQLHKLLGLKNEIGLTDLLQNQTELDKFFQKNSIPNLTFISRGTNQEDPGNLFLSPKLEAILFRWRKEFDYVLIDTCPVFAADDAVTLAPKVDGTLLIVRSGYSRFTMVDDALTQLAQRQAHVLGVIYNQAKPSKRSNYHYSYAEYVSVKENV